MLTVLPDFAAPTPVNRRCLSSLKVIEATDSTLYVAFSSDRGSNSQRKSPDSSDTRYAPDIWADGEYFPAIYAVGKAEVSVFEYSATALSK